MAMNIISKEKKEIKWIGLPTNSAQECQSLEVPGCPGVLGGPGGAGHSRAAPGGDPGLEADGPGRVHSTSWPVGVLKNVVSTPRGGEAGRRWCSPETEEPPACLAAAASSGPLVNPDPAQPAYSASPIPFCETCNKALCQGFPSAC